MKKTNKTAAVLAAFVLILASLLPCVQAAAAPTPAEAAHFQFREDGGFRIMILADIQDGKNLSSITKTFIEETVRATHPDIIVMTGDNIYGSSTRNPENGEKALRDVMDMLQALYDEGVGAPVAATFGNHDDQSNDYAKEDQMKVMSEYACNISIDEDLWVDGEHYTEALEHCGTYNVPIYASSGDSVKFNLWLFDSGAYASDGNKGYDHVREKQLEWYKTTSDKLGNVNSIVFQHIIMPEIYNSYAQTTFKPGAETYNYHGTYYTLPDTAAPGSSLGEASACSEDNGGEYDALKAQGGVIACVSGHDHVNSFIIPNSDPDFPMDWINCPTCGVASYGKTDVRGIRVIDLNEADTTTYETTFYKYADIMGGDSAFMLRYKFVSFFTQLEYKFINIWMQFTNLLGISNLVA
ncbi:MAG: metallophosphoesterase [Clostridia bacterium]|nr:metallophosphoesterase [Clostridia bacterium]